VSAAPQPAALSIRGLVKGYRDQPVLQGVDLELQPGECLALVGRNGAGKTTLLRCLLDLCFADAGEVRIFGEDHRRPEARRHLAYLPERFQQPGFFRGSDLLRYLHGLHAVTPDGAHSRALLDRLGLSPRLLRLPLAKFSRGSLQKLGLAACLGSGKPLLLLDEPMNGLDLEARAVVREAMQTGTARPAVLFSTHLVNYARLFCDRLAILHRGRVAFHGTPQQCLGHYGGDDLEQACLRCLGGPPA